MFQSRRALSTVVVAVALVLSSACDDAPPAAPTASPDAARPAQAPGSALPSEMVAAVSASKSSLILGVHFALRAPPVVGKPLPVDIAVVPHRPFDQVRVSFDSQDGLQVTSGQTMGPHKDVSAEKSLSHTLTLEPLKEGVFMVTATVETDSDEGNIVRMYSIPVIVQGAVAAPAS